MNRKFFFFPIWMLLIISSVTFLQGCTGEIVATVPPPEEQVEIIVVAPSPRHVWVPGHYVYRRGHYMWIAGHYRVHPRSKPVWQKGHWKQTANGYVWVEGRWKEL